ncbi:pheromone-binding protein-related protein 6-like [Contarinia nasturtii]|uniref:pheromone-binding protein-related protein 6-like n=1 Tax=Contarinia nasturtii TaxID=265458 RepID=UPI0012D3D3D8|nr:pheromone-binding protein-related protein 6-like [Contarinia nasturtii]XP_031632564.1 pheromone-binding protein-related protein 6-like [Contarinia nasturtii]
MKFIAFSLFVFVTLLQLGQLNAREVLRNDEWPTPELLKFLAPIRKKCQAQIGISDEAIKEYDVGDSLDAKQSVKCYMACIFRESNAIAPNGDVNMSTFEPLLSNMSDELKTALGKLFVACPGNMTAEDDCERIYLHSRCMKEADPKIYFLI